MRLASHFAPSSTRHTLSATVGVMSDGAPEAETVALGRSPCLLLTDVLEELVEPDEERFDSTEVDDDDDKGTLWSAHC